MNLSDQRARTMLRTRTDHLTKVVQTLYLVYIPPNETGSPQTAHLCILPSQLSTWIPSPSSSPLTLSISFVARFKSRFIQSERHPHPRLRLHSRGHLRLAPPRFPRILRLTSPPRLTLEGTSSRFLKPSSSSSL